MLVSRVVGTEVNVLSEVVEVGLVKVVDGEEDVTGEVVVVVELESTGAGDEVTVGARATVVGLTVTVPPPVLGAVLLKMVRSSVLLATDTVGDVAVWVALNNVLTEVLGLAVEVERLLIVLVGMIGVVVVIGVPCVVAPTIGNEAVLVVTAPTMGSKAAVASTVLDDVGDPLVPVKEATRGTELGLPTTALRI